MRKREPKLIDVALGKPVVYLETQLVKGAKVLNQRRNYERYSVNAGSYPSRLTDGDTKTTAYPASWFFDYIIDLESVYQVKEVRLVWGMFGKEPNYITEWHLYSQTDFSDTVEKHMLISNEGVDHAGAGLQNRSRRKRVLGQPFHWGLLEGPAGGRGYVQATQADAPVTLKFDPIVLSYEWDEKKHAVERLNLDLKSPKEFPEKYKRAILKSMDLCTIKRHIVHPPEFIIRAS